MKRVILLAGGLAACLSLSACAGLANLTQAGGIGEKVLNNLEGCRRHYQGALGAGVTGSFDITCDPMTAKAAAADLSSIRTEPATPPGGT